MTDNQAVIYQFYTTSDGKKIVQATLNSEKSLNALNQEMIESLLEKLALWQDDDNIVTILLDSVGDRAFCAGGDIVQLYQAMSEAPDSKQPYVEEFFTKEYRLDHMIHTYPKPIIVWGNGFVMGGGLGLMAGASHRVVTETSKVAMPEISIGLYPDVGATYFLNKMPDNLGLFLGLTAAQMNASDCLEVKLADHFLLHQQKSSLITALTTGDYTNDDLHQQVSNIINGLAQESIGSLPLGNIANHREALLSVLSSKSLTDVIAAIGSMESDDKWLVRAQRSLANGSAVSACILERQLLIGSALTLAQCFQLELSLSVRCGELGEFAEGIRALLIDKDNQPKWLYNTVENVDKQLIDKLFAPIWNNQTHPLQLGIKTIKVES